jgi:hypothetical protein
MIGIRQSKILVDDRKAIRRVLNEQPKSALRLFLLFHFSDVARDDSYRLESSCIVLVECHLPEHMKESAVTVNDPNLVRKVSLLVHAPF